MRHRLVLAALVPVVVTIGGVGTAHAAPSSGAPSNAHGQCVSEAAKGGGQGGRAAVAKDKGTCTPPLLCTENNNVDRDSRTNTVTITGTGPLGPDSVGSSLECDTNVAVASGDKVTFDYSFTDETQTCGGGVPRVFVVVDAIYYNSHDGNPDCDGTVSITIPQAGTVSQVGFVYDKGDTGSVTYSNTKIGGVTLNI